jgi:hypothetical protein
MSPDRLVTGLNNPQLLLFQDEFAISGFAFVVQCSNIAAPTLLQHNPASLLPGYTELEAVEQIDELDRDTPSVDSSPTAWLFPRWKPQKVLYIFGTLASQCDVVLPPGEKFISRRHFAVYLSNNGVWMLRNLSQYGTWVNGDLLGVATLGEVSTQTTLNPDASNDIRVGNFECSIHTIPHVPLTDHNDKAVSLLLALKIQSEGSRTTSATETSVIYRPTNIQTEAYHFLRERPIVVQRESKVYAAVHKISGQYFIAKMYGTEEGNKTLAQFEMMLNFKVCNH